MKKLLLIVFAVFSMTTLFAQDPTLQNGSVEFGETMDNTYYINYTQFITSSNFKVPPGTGYIDLKPNTQLIDDEFDNSIQNVKARENCKYLKFKAKNSGTPGTPGYFYIAYRVIDSQGNTSNTGYIQVKINWVSNPQSVMVDPCDGIQD